jgi:hypothetical protein
MDAEYTIACGIVWHKTADPEAGWDLVDALRSPDPYIRLLAQNLLASGGEESMRLLEDAIGMGIITPEAASACMAEILRGIEERSTDRQSTKNNLLDCTVC